MKPVPVLPQPLDAPHDEFAPPQAPPALLRGIPRLDTRGDRHGTETDLRRAIELLPGDHGAARSTRM